MLKKLNWQAYTSGTRQNIIETVKNAITSNGGCITNFNMFSDLALSLSIEIEENQIVQLYQALTHILTVSDFDTATIRPNAQKEWLIFLNLSFSAGKGNLKIDIPEVSG